MRIDNKTLKNIPYIFNYFEYPSRSKLKIEVKKFNKIIKSKKIQTGKHTLTPFIKCISRYE